MSGRRTLIPEGLGAVETDLQRIADAAYSGDDRAFQALMFPGSANGSVVKRVQPLHDELRAFTSNALFANSPRVLCFDAAFLGGTQGRIRLLPCLFQVIGASTAPAAQQVTVSALLASHLDTSANLSSSAAGRVDTIYATVAWNTPVDGQRPRRVKSTTTGVVGTQTVNVYADLAVTLGVSAGTEGSATPGAVPADGASSWNFKLCEVVLAPGYTAGNALLSVRQRWDRAWINAQAVRGARPGVRVTYPANADAGLGDAEVLNSSRFGDHRIVRTVFRNTAANARVVLDNGIDWRMREARITLIRSTSYAPGGGLGEFVPPDRDTVGGYSTRFETGWTHTGASGDHTTNASAFWSDAGPPTVRLFAQNAGGGAAIGSLVLEIDDAPDDAANGGDHWTAIMECLGASTEVL